MDICFTKFFPSLFSELCDNVCQWLETARWISQRTPVSSTNKTDRQRYNGVIVESGIKNHKANMEVESILSLDNGVLFCEEFCLLIFPLDLSIVLWEKAIYKIKCCILLRNKNKERQSSLNC
jgi:hypothetical protein